MHDPAKLFGLYPRKGTIAPGSDADLVIFDPSKRKTITVANQRSKTDYNLYEGTEVSGDVDTVLVRGTVVVDDGELKVEPGFGEFVERAKFGEELTRCCDGVRLRPGVRLQSDTSVRAARLGWRRCRTEVRHRLHPRLRRGEATRSPLGRRGAPAARVVAPGRS